MIIVVGEVVIAPGDIEKMRPAVEKLVSETRKETGCLAYAFSQDLVEPGMVRIYERWTDQAALDAHLQTPHIADFNSAMQQVTIQSISVKIYESDIERTMI